ncbi:MAG: hypothetical protein AAGJ40_13595 [Planctomycetota bacterium]
MNTEARTSDAPATPRVTDPLDRNTFMLLGVPMNECRVTILRSAVANSARDLAATQLRDPSPMTENRLTQIVTSGYRVMDPRHRPSHDQRIQVGRILPNALSYASHTNFKSVAFQTAHRHDQSAMGTDLRSGSMRDPFESRPETPSSAVNQLLATDSQWDMEAEWDSDPDDSLKTELEPSVDASPHATAVTMPPRPSERHARQRESAQVADELRRASRRGLVDWSLWMSRRVLPGAVAAAVLISVLTLSWNDREDRDMTSNNRGDSAAPATQTDEFDSVALEHEDRQPTPPDESTDAAALSLNAPSPDRVGPAMRQEPDLANSIPPEGSSQLSAIVSAEVAAIEAEFMNADRSDGGSAEPFPTISAAPTAMEERPDRSNDRVATTTRPNQVPVAREVPADVQAAIKAVWEQTERASRRFNADQAHLLIRDWDLLAELSDGVIADASGALSAQAAWLTESINKIQRRHDAGTLPWDATTVERLMVSWQACRARVDRTQDLNVLLRRANDLLDQCILSHQIEDIEDFTYAVDSMTPYTNDTEASERWLALTNCLDTMPTRVELVALQAKPSGQGMAGRVLCLKLRRWEEGLRWLVKSSDRKLASAAQDEWKARQLVDLDNRHAELERVATRWTKLAVLFDGRDRESIQLHAMELRSEEDSPRSRFQ